MLEIITYKREYFGNRFGKVELIDILLAFGEIFTRPELLKHAA